MGGFISWFKRKYKKIKKNNNNNNNKKENKKKELDSPFL